MLLQYEPVDIEEPKNAPPGFYVAEIRVGLQVARVGIVPYYNQVEAVTVEEAQNIAHFIKTQIEQEYLQQGIIVTMLELTHEIKKLLDPWEEDF
jgi:hypothetical protein